MKNVTALIILFLNVSFIACSTDETIERTLLDQQEEEPIAEIPDESEVPEDDVDNTPKPNDIFSCTYSELVVEADTTVLIDCLVDLEGGQFDIPKNVKFKYSGGDIFNGTLNFGSGGEIDGALMSSSLTLGGDVVLMDDEATGEKIFEFDPKRWENITEGQTTSSIAQTNTNELETLFYKAKELGATKFKIDQFDAYFEVGKVTSTTTNQNFYPSIEAINIPGDFELIMTDKTILRVYPNDAPKYSLLAVRDVSNVVIRGGKLVGDRNKHSFSDGGTHEWGHCLELHAAVDVKVIGVHMSDGNGDGMKIHSLNFTFQDNYVPSHSIEVTDCVFDSNRRNNLSITDGYDILVQNSTFLNAGIDTSTSEGIEPKFGIDIEAHRERDTSTGQIVFYERAHDIVIRNNVEKNSQSSGFGIYIGENVIIEDNVVETKISWGWTEGSVIRNNTLVADPSRGLTSAIVGGRSDNSATTFNNKVYGNEISGYETGITIYGRENKVYNNIIENCEQGIFLRYLKDSQIYNNQVSSTVSSSKGIFGNLTTIDNVDIYENEIDVLADAFKFDKVNNDAASINYTFTVDRNEFNSTSRSTISDSNGLVLRDNITKASTSIYNSSNISILSNEINSESSTGIYLREVNEDIVIIDNIIQVKTNGECVKIESSTSTSEVTESNNTCL